MIIDNICSKKVSFISNALCLQLWWRFQSMVLSLGREWLMRHKCKRWCLADGHCHTAHSRHKISAPTIKLFCAILDEFDVNRKCVLLSLKNFKAKDDCILSSPVNMALLKGRIGRQLLPGVECQAWVAPVQTEKTKCMHHRKHIFYATFSKNLGNAMWKIGVFLNNTHLMQI